MNIFKKIKPMPNGSKLSATTTTSSPIANTPTVLTVTAEQQKDKFNELNEIESNRIIEGLNDVDSIWTVRAALDKKNKARNRYANVSPYDRARVKIPVVDDATYSDYINASYMRLETNRGSIANDYIACQGPLPATRNHFWSMCFSESEKQGNDVIIVVMVTPLIEQGMVKCDRYWPAAGESWDFSQKNKEEGIVYGEMEIANVQETVDADDDYLLTQLELKAGEKTKKVYHFYYYKWADAKVPPSFKPLAKISNHVAQVKSYSGSGSPPVPVVHCSAGVGRSGTFMIYDHLFRDRETFKELLDSAAAVSNKDVIYKAVASLRSRRMMMVQTVYQFQFLYEVARTFYEERSEDEEFCNSHK
ncbi:uncharacterized protein LODBEIA_P18110 [Lodderomyces beijingensis]|uniref:Uncharacterized protein n=1 Tax=Lodderomyces beijingensis TaxID=1775926 RepID=A0ABP0ZHE0_9ASCO